MTRKKHINKFLAPTQSRDNPANLLMFMCFFFPSVRWIQEGSTVEPAGANCRRNDSDLGSKVRVTGQKSEIRPKSRRYSQTDPRNPNRTAKLLFQITLPNLITQSLHNTAETGVGYHLSRKTKNSKTDLLKTPFYKFDFCCHGACFDRGQLPIQLASTASPSGGQLLLCRTTVARPIRRSL